MQNRFGVFDLDSNKFIQILYLLKIIVVNFPSGFEDFNHDVIVDIIDEVCHLLMCKIKAVESVFHTWDLGELVRVCDS